ncbi:MAG: hypothetical protein FWF02_14635 [Micrococcales bacterium]|nr:hypothetical protein [Micrococcales bacterium]MCL2668915.1 hypothetical protein [Micrococcales bacterium]
MLSLSCTSMQALIERAYHLGTITVAQRSSLYKQMSARRWRIVEPASDEVPVEEPCLVHHIADSLVAKGLSPTEVAQIAGFWSDADNDAFVPTPRRLHVAPTPPRPTVPGRSYGSPSR